MLIVKMRHSPIFCSVCDISVPSKAFSAHLRTNLHKNNNSIQLTQDIEKISSAFRSRIASYRVRGPESSLHETPSKFLCALRKHVQHILEARRAAFGSIKVNFELFAEFCLPKNETCEIKSFATQNIILHQSFEFKKIFSTLLSTLCTKIDEFQERDSGWCFLRNLYLEVNINKYNPLRASRFIELPKIIKHRRACINIRNNDNFCFLWSIVAALFPAQKNQDRTSSYPHFENILITKNMTFPVGLSDIKIFEKNNQKISVNVYGLRKNEVVGPLYKSGKKRKHHVNLLMMENGDQSHYCLIKNLGRLLKSQLTKHNGKIFFCEECLIFFYTADKLNKHVCGGVATVLPDRGTHIQFKHFERMQLNPYVVYADFECILQPITGDELNSNCTTTLQKHVPAAFAYYIVCSYNSSLNKYVTYRGQDCVSKFLSYLKSDVAKIKKIYDNPAPLKLTEEEENQFKQAKYCFLCNKLLLGDAVREHCHLTGRFRGASHAFCNLQFRLPKFVPVFFHNLSGYDCHLFIRELGEMPGRLKVIAKNKENYISFTKFFHIDKDEFVPVRFVDSFKFLGTSLEKLAADLNNEDFVHLRSFFPDHNQFALLRSKGVYPYEYITCWNTYEEKKLPPQHCFYSSITDNIISNSEYNQAKHVWNAFNVKTLGEYTDLYLKSDVLLLADIFENFRHTSMLNYKLDPAFYMTAPSLSFDAMLLITNIRLELINDLEIIRMIQKGIRGGVCLCSTRYAHANNKYMPDYDASVPDSFLFYIDCNNLYGFAMCSYLPFADFKLLSEEEIEKTNFLQVPDNSLHGYILEVDLEYPEYLHNLHNDIPFCPQKFVPPGSKNSKLIPNLYDKYEYVIHYVHLKTCVKHGLKLKKIHRVIQFKQSRFIQQYIDLNTELRKNAKSEFQMNFYKLLNNSLFGKTLESTENRTNVMLANQWTDTMNKTKKKTSAEILIARPNFHSASVFTENLVAIQMNPEIITLDKPIYIGFTVLEISKSHMYNFHYSHMKPFYGENLSLCYMDTDSFLYLIKTNDLYRDLKFNFDRYLDTSNYAANNIYDICQKNKKVPGLFKDELGGELILQFVGLRSKLYCVKTQEKQIKKAKGTKKHAVRDLRYSDYENVLFNQELVRKKNSVFKSIKHEIYTQALNKVALSSNDDKRVILKDNIHTLSWGHASFL
jgi:hypothetical protein